MIFADWLIIVLYLIIYGLQYQEIGMNLFHVFILRFISYTINNKPLRNKNSSNTWDKKGYRTPSLFHIR
jgi:hypothetical protein